MPGSGRLRAFFVAMNDNKNFTESEMNDMIEGKKTQAGGFRMKKWTAILAMLICMLLCAPAMADAEGAEVILPEGYETSGLKYPVVYVLPEDGYTADESGLAQAIAAQEGAMDMIIVLPSFAEGADPAAEMAALAAKIDAEYRTVAQKEYRALAGTGVGGYLAYAIGLEEDSAFGILASVRGDFAGAENPWLGKYGDVYAKMDDMGAKAFEGIYTYIDAPVDDEWTDMQGSTDDIGALFIGFGTSSEHHEFTVRPGAFTQDFLNESAARIADRLTKRMLGGIAAGEITLASSTVGAQEDVIAAEYTVETGDGTAIFGDQMQIGVVLLAVDPQTGDVLSETAAQGLSGSAEVEIGKIGGSGEIVLAAEMMGARVELGRANIVRMSDVLIDGDVQKMELAGDWYFRYAGKQAIAVKDLTAEEYESWSVVQAGIGNWADGYGNISEETVDLGWGGKDYFNYMITGNGYYVKSFFLPQEFDSEELILSIGYIDDRCEVYLNGVKVGSTGMTEDGKPNGETTWAEYSKFKVDPALVVRGGENVVVVRAWNDEPYGAGGWYAGPIGLYSKAAMEGGDGGSGEYIEKTFASEYAAKATGKSGTVDKEYLVVLPDGYETSGKRYPTVYLLHQFNSDHTSYKADGIAQLMREGAAAGLFDEMIVVIPNSDGNSWWKDNWEKMVTDELVPLIDAQYRTVRDARFRFTAGCSMGGQGAFSVALHNPDLFSGVVSFYGAFSYGGKNSPNSIAAAESAEYMDYFGMYFICGNQDSYGFGASTIDLHQILLEKGVEHGFFIENGGHDSAFYVPYFDDAFGYMSGNMFAADEAAFGLVSGSVDASGAAEYAADEAILGYCNVVPASSYMEETVQGIDVALIVRAVKGGEVVFESEPQHVLIAEGALSGAVQFDLSGADTDGCELVLAAQFLGGEAVVE